MFAEADVLRDAFTEQHQIIQGKIFFVSPDKKLLKYYRIIWRRWNLMNKERQNQNYPTKEKSNLSRTTKWINTFVRGPKLPKVKESKKEVICERWTFARLLTNFRIPPLNAPVNKFRADCWLFDASPFFGLLLRSWCLYYIKRQNYAEPIWAFPCQQARKS